MTAASDAPRDDRHVPPTLSWLDALRRYLVFVALANLLWEFAHLPLYTIWETGMASEIAFAFAFAALHCTGGDVLIALSSITLALFVTGARAWPVRGVRPVVALTLAFGLAYTVFSEWLNIEVRQAWAYSDLMPVIPVIDAGLSPLLQWIVIPLAAFRWALGRAPGRDGSRRSAAAARTALRRGIV